LLGWGKAQPSFPRDEGFVNRRLLPILLAAAGGVVEALTLPLAVPILSLREVDPAGHLQWLAWVGLVPVLFALDRASTWKRAFWLGTLAGFCFGYVAIYWVSHAMTSFGEIPWGAAFVALTLLVLFMAVHWGGALAVSWVIRSRLGWPWWRHLPLVWTGFELLRNYLFTGYPWGNLGYTQSRQLPIAQLASLFGIYAIAALVVLVNCAVHAVWVARREGKPFPIRLAAGVALVVLAVVGYGAGHLAWLRKEMAAAPKLRVGLVQANLDQSIKNEHDLNAEVILRRQVPLTLEADRAGADLIVWPEAAYPYLVSPFMSTFAGGLAKLPTLQRAHLLLGAATLRWVNGPKDRKIPEVTNATFLVSPDLTVLGKYTKHHLVPFGEYIPLAGLFPFLAQVVPDLAPTTPGQDLVALRFPVQGGDPSRRETSIAPMICFDALFPEINVAYARHDPELLVNPTNDAWYGYSSGPYQFLEIVKMRAIEAGKAMARPAYAGVTALILPTGELAPGTIGLGPVDPEHHPQPDQGPKLLLGDVPRLRGRTPYTRFGDLFAYASALYGAAALALAIGKRKDAANVSPEPPAEAASGM
jgi:apolipoprotein N-acyltransferase